MGVSCTCLSNRGRAGVPGFVDSVCRVTFLRPRTPPPAARDATDADSDAHTDTDSVLSEGVPGFVVAGQHQCPPVTGTTRPRWRFSCDFALPPGADIRSVFRRGGVMNG